MCVRACRTAGGISTGFGRNLTSSGARSIGGYDTIYCPVWNNLWCGRTGMSMGVPCSNYSFHHRESSELFFFSCSGPFDSGGQSFRQWCVSDHRSDQPLIIASTLNRVLNWCDSTDYVRSQGFNSFYDTLTMGRQVHATLDMIRFHVITVNPFATCPIHFYSPIGRGRIASHDRRNSVTLA